MGESILSRVSRLVGTLRRRARVWGDPDEDDDDDFGLGDLGLSTPSGVKLTRRKAYSVSSWYRAIKLATIELTEAMPFRGCSVAMVSRTQRRCECISCRH